MNGWIQESHPVETRMMALAEAKAAGAVAMFGEKYSDTVRFLAVRPSSERASPGAIHCIGWAPVRVRVLAAHTSKLCAKVVRNLLIWLHVVR